MNFPLGSIYILTSEGGCWDRQVYIYMSHHKTITKYFSFIMQCQRKVDVRCCLHPLLPLMDAFNCRKCTRTVFNIACFGIDANRQIALRLPDLSDRSCHFTEKSTIGTIWIKHINPNVSPYPAAAIP